MERGAMIVAGIGLRRQATLADLRCALDLAGVTPDRLAVLNTKATPPLTELALQMGIPLILVPEQDVSGIQTPTQSNRIIARFATGSLAEALALRAAGAGATLTISRVTSPNGMATAAIAKGPTP
jgi:cobalt-precorrin 5A hydrolase